jgi:hypothetical protein
MGGIQFPAITQAAFEEECRQVDATFQGNELQAAHKEEVRRKYLMTMYGLYAPTGIALPAKREDICRRHRSAPFACDELVLSGMTCRSDCPVAQIQHL